ncbi:MAG: PHP domain-containing protein [Candidatus Omnitrophica bacterium]|nr:PHP domain-containing protein [Candidatus Omnitrophota bacterium]
MDGKHADLHLHTNFSDSTFTPAEVVLQAGSVGISTLAITDHDTTAGIQPAIDTGSKLNIEIIPGIELTSSIKEDEVHILGYFINRQDGWFQARLNKLSQARLERLSEMVKTLNRAGIILTAEEVLEITGNPASVGRMHVALALLHKKIVSSAEEAFQKFLRKGCPAYVGVESFGLSPSDSIQIIRKAKGIPVLAHPKVTGKDDYIPEFIKDGLMGIEVYHSEHSQSVARHYRSLAEKYNLLITGGSDCHGLGKGKILSGSVKLPYVFVERLRQAHEKIIYETGAGIGKTGVGQS